MTRLKSKVKARARKKKSSQNKQKYDKYIRNLREKVLLFDDPILKQKSEIVCFSEDKESYQREKEEFEKDIKLLRKVLAVTENGLGLAACQIGITKRVIAIRPYLKDTKKILIMINPEITEFGEEKEVKMEGCLSYPNIHVPVERSKKITVKYFDEDYKEQSGNFEEIYARIICHEVDHLEEGWCQVAKAWFKNKKNKTIKDST